jgi:hypothetical protein
MFRCKCCNRKLSDSEAFAEYENKELVGLCNNCNIPFNPDWDGMYFETGKWDNATEGMTSPLNDTPSGNFYYSYFD